MPLFNAGNAAEMGRRGQAARKAAEAQRGARAAATPLSAASSAETALGIDASCVRARLEILHSLMMKAKADREWDNLSRAYERHFRVLMVLTNTPGPGNLRPRELRAGRQSLPPAPDLPLSSEPPPAQVGS